MILESIQHGIGKVLDNTSIWSPVVIGWAVGWVGHLLVEWKKIHDQALRNLIVYPMDWVGTLLAYEISNFPVTRAVFQEGMVAGAVSMLLAAAWFNRSFFGFKK